MTVRVERSEAKLREVETPAISQLHGTSTSRLRRYAQCERGSAVEFSIVVARHADLALDAVVADVAAADRADAEVAAHAVGVEVARTERSEERRVGKECRSRW